ncbi:MAG: hypothetical protein M3238_02920 [Actinomycetota bacterium]|nr:hypothetical protein [Actinomycetota bacterium]
MTALIGGSVLLIAGSALALVFGWISADPSLIWISIVGSVGAAIFLALGYSRSKSELASTPARGGGAAAEGVSGAPGAGPGEVVAVPERRRFHRPDCRYARVRGAEPMSPAAARQRGYDPCAICKP